MAWLLGICGSLRAGSFNRKLLAEAVSLYAPGDYREGNIRLPLYDGDLEERGIPPEVTALAEAIRGAEAVVIATPEYNKALPGGLKNALDWVSRTKLSPWRDKPVAIISAAGGRAGGDRSQFSLRLAMVPFRAEVLAGPEVLVGEASAQFDAAGRLVNERYIKTLAELMDDLKHRAARKGGGPAA